MKMYAARDRNGKLFIYFGFKPEKMLTVWRPQGDFCWTSEDLPSIKWEDKEPTAVEYDKVTHKLKVKK